MKNSIVWKNLIGQQRIKETLGAAFGSSSLGHAYLFCGAAGVGKFQAALELSFALLCDREDTVPCYECDSCRMIRKYSHPDFHLVFPVTLEKAHKKSGGDLSDEGWKYIAERTVERINNPYMIEETRLMNIPVEWVRELNHSIMRGTIRGKTNVAIVCDVDIMQKASANAMLKTLEEPPSNTVIFLLSERPHAVLPTIRSRCQIMRFGTVADEELKKSLCSSGMDSDDPKIAYAVECSGGSYGKALALVEESIDEYAQAADNLWRLCSRKASFREVTQSLEAVVEEHLGGGFDYSGAEKLLLSFLHVIRKTYLQNINGKEAYSIGGGDVLQAENAGELYSSCEKAISAVRARGNILLVLITFLMSVSEILHE